MAHEARFQLRSLRFRVLAAVYLLLCSAPSLLLLVLSGRGDERPGPATFASFLFLFQPGLTAVLAGLLSVDGIVRERQDGSFAVVSLTRVSGASYLLGRWLSINALLAPLTLLPPLVAGTTAQLSGAPLHDAGPFLVPWLLQVAPVLLSVSALALGLGTLACGLVPAAILGAVFILGLEGVTSDILARFHRGFSGPGEAIALDPNRLAMLYWILKGWTNVPAASEAPVDAPDLVGYFAPRLALLVGFGALSLGVSTLYLRRTRPDVRPSNVPRGHVFFNFARILTAVRVAARPDPRPAAADRLAALAGVLAFVGSATYLGARGESMRGLAVVRYEAEKGGGPEPTPLGMVPVSWSLQGSLSPAGSLEGNVGLEMRNDTPEPVSHLAFSLNPLLLAEAVEPRSAPGRWTRAWDRLALDLSTPVPPGGVLRVSLRVFGTPRKVRHGFAWRDAGFADRFAGLHRDTLALGKYDFSRSFELRLSTPGRTFLEAHDLFPVPRYTSWALRPVDPESGERERAVPAEVALEPTDVSTDLRVPPGVLLADACGGVSGKAGASARLRSTCRLPLGAYRVAGGALLSLPRPPSGFAAVAVLPAHVEDATRHLPSLERAGELARQAWPQVTSFEGAVLLELPPELDPEPVVWWRAYGARDLLSPLSDGRLMLAPETTLTLRQPLAPERLAVQAVAFGLLSRRAVRSAERTFFSRLYRYLADSRLPSSRRPSAVLAAHHDVKEPLLSAGPYQYPVWNFRAPAVLRDLEARVGTRALDEGLSEFLSAGGPPGSCLELLRTIERRAGVSLERVYRDAFAGKALPVLTLVTARIARERGLYRVSGSLRNEGTGEALCPVVLRTDGEPMTRLVTVDSGQSAPFDFLTPSLPRLVQLDPDGRCFRHARLGIRVNLPLGEAEP